MKLRFIVLGLLFCLFMLYTSVSFARLSTQGRQEISNKILKLGEKGVISSNVATNISDYVLATNHMTDSNAIDGNYTIFIGNGSLYNGGGHNWEILDTNRSVYITIGYSNDSIVNSTNSISNTNYTRWTTWGYTYKFSASSGTGSGKGNFAFNDAVDGFYVYTTRDINTRLLQLSAGQEYGGNYLVASPPTFTTTSGRGTISVNYNGSSSNFNKLPFSLSLYQIELGTIENFNTDNVYQIIGQFGAYVGQDNLNNDIIDSSSRFTFTRLGDNSYDIKNGSLKFDSNTGKVYILTNKLIYNQGYNLYFEYYKDSSTYGGDFGNSNYYTLSLNSIATSGELINPNLNTSVDIDFINSINDFYSNDIQNFSGDFKDKLNGIFGDSGELFGIIYNDNDTWGFGTFVINLFRNILNSLSSYQDVTINFGVLGDISSSSFIITNSAINNFLSIFSNAILIIIIIFFYYRFIMNLSTLDINSLFSYDLDHTFNLF